MDDQLAEIATRVGMAALDAIRSMADESMGAGFFDRLGAVTAPWEADDAIAMADGRIMAVVAAARELQTDALEGLAADEWHRQVLPRKREFYQGLLDEIKRFDALVDALPPQEPAAADDPALDHSSHSMQWVGECGECPPADQLRFKGMFRGGEDTIARGHGVGCVVISVVGQGVQTATVLAPGEAERLGRALIHQAEAALPADPWTIREAAEPGTTVHGYVSTACQHDHHEYCASDTRQDGFPKTPAKCKWCPATCLCGCHLNVLTEKES